MPAFSEEVNAAIEEGIEIIFLTAPTKIITGKGKVTGIECLQMELGEMDKSGRRRPVPIEGSEFIIKLDTLIAAIGEVPDPGFLIEENGIEISKWNTITVNPETFATNVEGVFAGGDIVTGPNTVIEAMSSGKIAAEMIDKYIREENLVKKYEVTRPSKYLPPVELTDQEIEEAERPSIPCLKVDERIHSFDEVDLNLTEELAVKEARRCLRCDLETIDGKKAIGE